MLTVWCGSRDAHNKHEWQIDRQLDRRWDGYGRFVRSRCGGVTKQEAHDIALGKTEGGLTCHTPLNG